ncbi:MAG: lipid IV(A) 3-deoxy-D-manno-octulosonic acid transferase [Gammaproteobacteria bacterium]|nr:lipid IV(A) 3-deoxy-D-manno-octulosonic acid transferase [Gammaproteobacteria bacterium]
MRYLYTALFYLLLPFILLRLIWKGRQNPAYRARLKERFSWGKMPEKSVDVWVHAVSLGEVVAAKMLIEQILKANQSVLVTTMTPTGSEQVRRLFGERVLHQYIPYDFPIALKRFFKAYQPRVGIIMETELWPNLMVQAKTSGVALFIANARISDGAFRAYQRVCWFFKPLFACVTGVFAQSEHDAERFSALGAPESKVHVLGNMKSDLFVSHDVSRPVRFLKQAWGDDRPVVIAASTHDGEEEQVLSVLQALQVAVPNVVLLIAPRHSERFETVYKLAKTHQFKTGRRSEEASIEPDTEVVVLDSLGELLGFYDLSDYAFVGGSLVSIGGHNVLEPIALEVPVFCGMFMQNSKSLCEELVRAEAMQQVADARALVQAIGVLHQNKDARDSQIARATNALKASQGAVARHVDAIASYWD